MMTSDHDREGSRRGGSRTSSPNSKHGMTDRSGSGNDSLTRRIERPNRVRQRQRSCSPSSEGGGEKQRPRSNHRVVVKKQQSSGRERRRTRRVSNSGGGEQMDWTRASRSPGRQISRGRQAKQTSVPPLAEGGEDKSNDFAAFGDDAFGELAAQHPNAQPLHRSSTEPANTGKRTDVFPKKEKRSSKTAAAALASSNDIDAVIAQFREQCDVHMATLLDLKNNITTTEKAVVVDNEKDKEFQQVRQWYSALAEKHTKLQKEHQALQEEHVKLQNNYMTLKRCSKLSDSFVAQCEEKFAKKKEKKDKGKLEVVWSRAGKITKNATNKFQNITN